MSLTSILKERSQNFVAKHREEMAKEWKGESRNKMEDEKKK